MARQWLLTGQEGFEASLEYDDAAPAPTAAGLGPTDVLVRLHAASLNYREIALADPGVCTSLLPSTLPSAPSTHRRTRQHTDALAHSAQWVSSPPPSSPAATARASS